MGINSLIEVLEHGKVVAQLAKEAALKASQLKQVDADMAELEALIGAEAYADLKPYIRGESAACYDRSELELWQIEYSFTAPQLQLVPFSIKHIPHRSDPWGDFKYALIKARAEYPEYEEKTIHSLERDLNSAWSTLAIDSLSVVALRKLPHFYDRIAELQDAAKVRIAETEKARADRERDKASLLAEYEKQYRDWAFRWKIAYNANHALFEGLQRQMNVPIIVYRLTYAAVARERDDDGSDSPWVELNDVYVTYSNPDKAGFYTVISYGGIRKQVKYTNIVSIEEVHTTPTDLPRIAKHLETPIGTILCPFQFKDPEGEASWLPMPEPPAFLDQVDTYQVNEVRLKIELETGIRELLRSRGDF